MHVKGIHLAWILTSDINRAKKFYNDIGLTLADDAGEYKWLEFKGQDGSLLGIGEQCDSFGQMKAGQNAVVTITVDGIVAAKAELEAKGVQFIGDIQEVPGHVKMALFADPDGNLLQLVQTLSCC